MYRLVVLKFEWFNFWGGFVVSGLRLLVSGQELKWFLSKFQGFSFSLLVSSSVSLIFVLVADMDSSGHSLNVKSWSVYIRRMRRKFCSLIQVGFDWNS